MRCGVKFFNLAVTSNRRALFPFQPTDNFRALKRAGNPGGEGNRFPVRSNFCNVVGRPDFRRNRFARFGEIENFIRIVSRFRVPNTLTESRPVALRNFGDLIRICGSDLRQIFFNLRDSLRRKRQFFGCLHARPFVGVAKRLRRFGFHPLQFAF